MDFQTEYSYQNPTYAGIKPIARAISNACLWGNRVGDTVKEKIRVQLHMLNTSDFFHGIAHKCLGYLDDFSDILHTANLEQEYPPTEGLAEGIEDLDKAFYVFTETLKDLKKALYDFIEYADNAQLKAMSIAAEDILEDVDEDFGRLITAWNMWKCEGSAMSFDRWVGTFAKGVD